MVFSFDGGGYKERWQLFLDTAKASQAAFTVFMTGTYFVPEASRTDYTPPGNPPGMADVAFSKSDEQLATLLTNLNSVPISWPSTPAPSRATAQAARARRCSSSARQPRRAPWICKSNRRSRRPMIRPGPGNWCRTLRKGWRAPPSWQRPARRARPVP